MSTGFENTLDILEILSEALTVPRTLDEGLDQIVQITCLLMETEQAAFLLIDEMQQRFIIRSAVGIDSPNFEVGQPLVLPERLLNILWRLQNLHQINWIDSGIDGLKFPIIAMPIRFRGNRIGHLVTGGAKDVSKTKDPVRRKMFSLLAPFASLIIENAKAADLLSQRFALSSRELLEAAERDAKDGDAASQLMVASIKNPVKVVRLLAESFHRELASAGFNSGQITIACAHLLDCIIKNGNRAKEEENKQGKENI
jgi:hypothetical protein